MLNQEIEHIKKILTHNGYPRYIVNKKIKNAISKEEHKERGQQTNNTLTTTSTAEANNKKKVISLSYTGNESFIFSRKLMRILRSVKMDIKIIFKKHKTIGQQFKEKMKGNDPKKIEVVYCIECQDCDRV